MGLITREILPVLLTLLLSLAFFHVSATISPEELEKLRQEARENLQKILGIHRSEYSNTPAPVPPEFMTKFYKEVADDVTGQTLKPYLYNSNMVRSYYQTPSSPGVYVFNPINLKQDEMVLEAQLHFFIEGTIVSSGDPVTCCTVNVYQVMENLNKDTPELHKLLSSRDIATNIPGWQVFDIKPAVLAWTSGEPQLGLMVTAHNSAGERTELQFLTVKPDDPMRAIIVLFDYDNDQENVIDWFDEETDPSYAWDYELDENRNRRAVTGLPNDVFWSLSIYTRPMTTEKPPVVEEVTEVTEVAQVTRRPRPIIPRREGGTPSLHLALEGKKRRKPKNVPNTEDCQLHSLHVNFTEMEMDDMIIAPLGYDANNCVGLCTAPILQDRTPTHHAIIRSIISLMGLAKDLKEPCCVPTAFTSLSILYYDADGDSFILRPYKEMKAELCGCR